MSRSRPSLALLLEAAGAGVLEAAGKILARRLGLDASAGADEGLRVVYRYRLEVVSEGEPVVTAEAPLGDGEAQARWLAGVVPRSPVEIGGGLYLDAECRPIGWSVYTGGFETVHLEPRQIFAPALLLNAAFVSVWHTHPELDPRPSRRDRDWTYEIQCCGRHLRIPVLESIVLGGGGRFAFVG